MSGWYGARLLILPIRVLLSVSGLVAFVAGLALIIGAVIERARYRSDEAERTAAPHGPGGGEPTDQPIDPRFRPTDERFEDPTTRRRMRVWADPNSDRKS